MPDIDRLAALAPERESLWASLEKTSFLTTDEKRALAGFPALGESQIAQKFNPHHDALGRFTFAPGDGTPEPAQGRRGPFRNQPPKPPQPPPGPGHNNPPAPIPVPPVVPLPGSDPPLPADQNAGNTGKQGDKDLPEFLRFKPQAGTLTGDLTALTPQERAFAEAMRDRGNAVEIIPSTGAGRTPDLRINGREYELKTVSGVQRTDLEGLSGAISNRILNGRGQAGDIIIDARNQAGITREIADKAISRAFGADERQGIKSITILTPHGVVHVPRRQ